MNSVSPKKVSSVWIPALLMLVAFAVTQAALVLYLSDHSFFWGDESHSVNTQFHKKIADYLVGKTSEGTVAPLFFLVQRFLLFSAPVANLLHIDQTFWQRLISTLPMWLTVLFFSHLAIWPRRYESLLFSAGIYLGVSGSAAILLYVWQARPYGLWLMLSALHSYYVWCILLESRENPSRLWAPLFLWATLLVACTPFGAMQVFSSLLLTLLSRRDLWREKALWIFCAWAVLLFAYSSFYSQHLSGYYFRWPGITGFVPLVASHFRWWFLPLLVLVWWAGNFSRADSLKLALLVLSAVAMFSLQILVFHRVRRDAGFEIANRYFLYLLPTLLVPALLLLRQKARAGELKKPVLAALALLSVAIGVHGVRKVAHAVEHVDPRNYRWETKEKIGALRALATTEGKHCLCFDRGNTGDKTEIFLAVRASNPPSETCPAYWETDGVKIGAQTISEGNSGLCH